MRKKHKTKRPTAGTTPDLKHEAMQPTTTGTLQIGDIVIRNPVTLGESETRRTTAMKGRVVYIHPKGRFHTVEFGEGQYAIRESFMGVDR